MEETCTATDRIETAQRHPPASRRQWTGHRRAILAAATLVALLFGPRPARAGGRRSPPPRPELYLEVRLGHLAPVPSSGPLNLVSGPLVPQLEVPALQAGVVLGRLRLGLTGGLSEIWSRGEALSTSVWAGWIELVASDDLDRFAGGRGAVYGELGAGVTPAGPDLDARLATGVRYTVAPALDGGVEVGALVNVAPASGPTSPGGLDLGLYGAVTLTLRIPLGGGS